MADITEIAVAAWRLEKWLDNVNVERKMAAKSALRAIKKYLQENEIEVLDLTGSRFDVGLAVSVVNNESDETDEEKLIISEMVKPIIKERGAVIQYGQVILGDEVKQQKANNVVEEAKANEAEKAVAEIVNSIEDAEKNITEEEKQVVANDIQNTEKKFPRIIGWACVVCLQLVIIALLAKTIGEIGTLKSSVPEQSVTVVNDSSNSDEQVIVDMSAIEQGLTDIDTRLSAIEEGMGNVNNSIDSLSGKIEEIETKEVILSDSEQDANGTSEYVSYVVQKGDTLMAICEAKGIDYYANINDILDINSIVDPNSIQVGQLIRLPRK